MNEKFNSTIILGLILFVLGLVLPFIDIFIIKSFGKGAETIGTFLLFFSLAVFVAGVIITLVGFHKLNKKFAVKKEE